MANKYKVYLDGCPWCWCEPSIRPWHGGKRTKKMISCDNEECAVSPRVSGETTKQAANNWNERGLKP